ncbi:MAG: hypothetical protein ACREX4_15310 [Gammaproteobacteria bacterium]
MGIYPRYTAAFLAFLFFISATHSIAATRKQVNHGQTSQSIIQGGAVTGNISTPAGQAAYFGQDYVDQHTAGNRFNAGDNPGGSTSSTASQPVKVKPAAIANKARAASKAVSYMRASIPGAAAMAAQAALIWAVDQIPDASWDGYKIQKKTAGLTPQKMWHMNPDYTGWQPSAQAVLDRYVQVQNDAPGNSSVGFFWRVNSVVSTGANSATGWYDTKVPPTSPPPPWQIKSGSILITAADVCVSGTQSVPCTPETFAPFQEADFQQLESVLATVPNAEWLRDMIEESCSGAAGSSSTSVASCYEDLVDYHQMIGPSQQLGPKTSSTTTTSNPDGTSSTTTTTSQNRYDYKYGGDYYDFTTTTTNKTTIGGQTTTQETTDAQPEGETPAEEQKPEEPEPTFEDAVFPSVEPFYEQKYPDGLSGVWTSAQADIDNSQFMQFLHSFVPSFSGSCPSFGLNMNIASWANYGSQQFPTLCYVFDFIKVLMLVTAVFTARALTLGG